MGHIVGLARTPYTVLVNPLTTVLAILQHA